MIPAATSGAGWQASGVVQRVHARCDRAAALVQRKSNGSEARANDVGSSNSVGKVLSSPGQPLDPGTRAHLEPRFGHDFSNVRVHSDERAAASAQAVNARAYTVGRNIVFGRGEYVPDSKPGRHLLAHELTHVVQQGASSVFPTKLERSARGNSSEHAARRGAAIAMTPLLPRSYAGIAEHVDGAAPPHAPQLMAPSLGSTSVQIAPVELTYDDGPDDAGITREILNELNNAGAKATFYLVGKRVNAGDNWRTVFDIAAAGHWLGNHAFDWNFVKDNHVFLNGSVQKRAYEILETELAIRSALQTGKSDAIANKRWDTIPQGNRSYIDSVIASGTGRYRTPGFISTYRSVGKVFQEDARRTGQAVQLVNNILLAAGLKPLAVSDSVDVDTKDWEKGKTKEDIKKTVADENTSSEDSILMHSRIKASAEATPDIVESIKSKKWGFDPTERGVGNDPAVIRKLYTKEQAFNMADSVIAAFPHDILISMWDIAHACIAAYGVARAYGPDTVSALTAKLNGAVVERGSFKGTALQGLLTNIDFKLYYTFVTAWDANASMNLNVK